MSESTRDTKKKESIDENNEDAFTEDKFSVEENEGDAFDEDNSNPDASSIEGSAFTEEGSYEDDEQRQHTIIGNAQQLVFGSDENTMEDDIDYELLFQQLRREIKKQGWFTDEWEMYLEGTYLQIYKKNWYNKQLHGIHFEVLVNNETKEKNMFPIMLHVEQDVPKKPMFCDAFAVAAAPWLKKLSEYEQNVTDYVLLKKEFPLNIQLLQKVLDEIDRLLVLVKPIDQALRICCPEKEEEKEEGR